LYDLVPERILCGIEVALREVVANLINGDAHVLEDFPQILSGMFVGSDLHQLPAGVYVVKKGRTVKKVHVR
jgi:hypothetical protein